MLLLTSIPDGHKLVVATIFMIIAWWGAAWLLATFSTLLYATLGPTSTIRISTLAPNSDIFSRNLSSVPSAFSKFSTVLRQLVLEPPQLLIWHGFCTIYNWEFPQCFNELRSLPVFLTLWYMNTLKYASIEMFSEWKPLLLCCYEPHVC